MPIDERSRARVLALQALCLFDAIGDGFRTGLDAFLNDTANYADLDWRRRPRPKMLAQARSLVAGAWGQHARYDQLLNEQVTGWSVERMQPVDRNILRLGLHELLECPETPHQVVLNEAIELAREFGGAESPAFVNGVLDGIRRKQGALPAFRGACQDDLGTSGQPTAPDLPDKEA